jgi:uncharacterized protein
MGLCPGGISRGHRLPSECRAYQGPRMELSADFYSFLLIGFVAQLVDGALGMAYGAISSALLLGMGVPPAACSLSVHSAEVATTAVSGFSHWRHGNIHGALFKRLAIFGVIGAAIGAATVGWVDASALKPWIALYLFGIGVLVLWRLLRPPATTVPADPARRTGVLGLVAGFLDAAGGGGWGSITTTQLVARGVPPRFVVGSVNAAEFLVSVTVTAILLPQLGFTHVDVVLGLLIGGVIAAPIAARVVKRAEPRYARFATGITIMLLCGYNLAQTLG